MAKKPTMYMETTEVPSAKSIGEITSILVSAGAASIQQTYESGKPTGVRWMMRLYGNDVWFQMPAKVAPVEKILRSKRSRFIDTKAAKIIAEQAERIAWRQLLRWVQVQMSLIELNMVEYAQVFLPYMVESANSGTTAWDVIRDQRFKMIEAPKQ